MHKDPARRYATVDALMRDIDHFLAGEPLEAQPDSVRYRTGKFVLREAEVPTLEPRFEFPAPDVRLFQVNHEFEHMVRSCGHLLDRLAPVDGAHTEALGGDLRREPLHDLMAPVRLALHFRGGRRRTRGTRIHFGNHHVLLLPCPLPPVRWQRVRSTSRNPRWPHV